MASRILVSACLRNCPSSVPPRNKSLLRRVLPTVLGIILSYALAAQAQAAILYVQQNNAVPAGSQSTVSVGFTNAQTAGNLNIVVVGWNDTTAAVSSVTDSKGNVYTRAVGPTQLAGQLSQSIYYAKNIQGASANSNTVTVKFNVPAFYPDIRILEYSGLDPASPVDVTAAATGSAATSSSGTATTASANDLIFGANTVTSYTSGPGAGFTTRVITYPDGDIAEDRIVSTTGSYSATAPLGSAGNWVMQMVAFRGTGPVGPVATGKWTTQTAQAPINPIHAALVPNGKVLIIAGSGNCPPSQGGCPTGAPYGPSNGSGEAVLDPVAQTFTSFSSSWDMFCNSMVLLPDGRALVAGGTTQYDPFHGAANTAIYDPSTNAFTNVQNMWQGRWYPTVVTLADGRALAFGGLDGNGNNTSLAEIYTVGSGWAKVNCGSTCWTPALYPRMHLLPNGKIFYSGPNAPSHVFDPVTSSWSTSASPNYPNRSYGSSVLLPLTPANNYDPKVMIMGGNSPATATTEIIDLGATTPHWQYGPNMSQPRIELNSVILPTGKVLVLGGSRYDEDLSSASLNADLYDPVTNTFSSAGANAYPRLYHSLALLLPDATVWLAGGNPSRGSYEPHIEIYQPAYLFQPNGAPATRPTITGAPSSITLGSQFSVNTPDAANIASVVLVRYGAVTHAFNADQRLVGMSFTKGSGVLTATAPPNHNIAPAGYYMLFIVNNSGVPSVSSSIKLQ